MKGWGYIEQQIKSKEKRTTGTLYTLGLLVYISKLSTIILLFKDAQLDNKDIKENKYKQHSRQWFARGRLLQFKSICRIEGLWEC